MKPVQREAALRCVLVLVVVFATAATAFAEGGVFSGSIGGMKNLYSSLGRLLQIIIGLGALFVLALIVFRIMQGDKESAGKLAWWLIGLAFGFVMISVLSGMADKIAGS